MARKILFYFILVITTAFLFSCGGAKYDPTTPEVDDETVRILGVAFPHPLPSLIAFTRDLPDDDNIYGVNREIFVMSPNGQREHRLTYNPADDDYPAFAPYGHGIAFVSNRSSGGYGAHDIFRIGPFGGIHQLTDDTWQWDAHGTDWGPGFITAARINQLTGAPFDVGQVIKIDPWGGNEDYINTGFMATYYPAIGNAINKLVFSARPPSGWYWGSMELYMLTDYFDDPVRLTFWDEEDPDPMNMIFTTNAQFDRRAQKVIFQTTYWGSTEIAWIDLSDSTSIPEPVRLTNNDYADMEPCWDPTGRWFCWVSDRDGNFELYKQLLYDPDSPTPIPPVIRLTQTEFDEHNPDWAPLMWVRKRRSMN